MLDSRVSKSVHSDTVDVIYATAETVAVEPATLFYSASDRISGDLVTCGTWAFFVCPSSLSGLFWGVSTEKQQKQQNNGAENNKKKTSSKPRIIYK